MGTPEGRQGKINGGGGPRGMWGPGKAKGGPTPGPEGGPTVPPPKTRVKNIGGPRGGRAGKRGGAPN